MDFKRQIPTSIEALEYILNDSREQKGIFITQLCPRHLITNVMGPRPL